MQYKWGGQIVLSSASNEFSFSADCCLAQLLFSEAKKDGNPENKEIKLSETPGS